MGSDKKFQIESKYNLTFSEEFKKEKVMDLMANGTIKNAYLAVWNLRYQKELFHLLSNAVENDNNRNHVGLNPTMTPLQVET